ncbi:MAG TPA: hypothetical protein EYQ14_30230 [Gammaproteobacteria bacterium]|nr:hypothetical protein [Gammaproteobacteria bacterium]HIL97663.1 hypothetical protein [Pseudomonadales bacterium]
MTIGIIKWHHLLRNQYADTAMTDFPRSPTKMLDELKALGLEEYVLQLEIDGLAVVPVEAHGVPLEAFDELEKLLLDRAATLVGCKFSVDRGPHLPLEFQSEVGTLASISEDRGEPSQFLIQQLSSLDRRFRDLAVNPAAVALIRHMIGPKATRFSSHNSFIKWQGDYGYGSSLGLHADQMAMPMPWGRAALTANTNWCLSDYTLEGGALAYVPGSHRSVSPPSFPGATQKAVPVEAPRGSMIIFHGATWHGAFPRKIPGMRISIANYYRHMMVTSQEDIQGKFDRELANDCCNPELFRELAGFSDRFPYGEASELIPNVKEVARQA